MSELRIVFLTELVRKLRSRVFWFATIAGVAAVAFLLETPVLFAHVAGASSNVIVLAGASPLRARAKTLLEARKEFRVVASVSSLPARVTPRYLDEHGKAGAAILVSQRGDRIHLDVYPRDLAAFDGEDFHALAPLGIELATRGAPAQIEHAATIDRSLHAIDAKFADSRTAALAHGIAFGYIFILYIAIIFGCQSVLSSVTEEKTSRIAEILVATIEPANLLAGKILAAAVVSVVQIVLWIATAAAILPQVAASLSISPIAAATPNASGSGAVPFAIDGSEAAAFLTFFVLGYLQYATLYAAAASLVSRTEDLASVTTPIILPVVGAFFVAQFALLAPNAPFVVACSFMPFLSPFVMFTRIAISSVPSWQIATAVLIDALSVAVCFWAAGKVYRVGMLLYGKPPSPKQVLAAVRN